MATTATLTLTSADIAGDPVNVSKTTTCTKAGGTIDLDQSTGLNRIILRETTNKLLLGATAGGNDLSAKVYLINKATDPTQYITVTINAQTIGKLYAGDGMFIPWSQTDTDADIEVAATSYATAGGPIPIEYCLFHEDSIRLADA